MFILGFVYKFFLAPFIRLYIKKVEGRENLPRRGGFVLAFHHESYADGLLVTAPLKLKHLRRFHALAKEDIFHLKGWKSIVGVLLKILKTIHTNGGVQKVIKYYRKDSKAIILIAPILHRATKPYHVGPGTGVAVIAISAKVPVVPVGIHDSRSIWPLGYQRPKSLWPKRKIIVRYGKPMEFRQYYGKKLAKSKFQEVANKVASEIERISRRQVNV